MENEIKFKVKEVKGILNALISLGAKVYPREREVDYSFDTLGGFLFRQGKLLRLRKIEKEAILTFKGPIIASRFKKRKEINIKLNDFKSAFSFLEQVGFIGYFNKEKIRQKFTYKKIEIFLDKLPFIGYYLEIEGGEKAILNLMKRLDLDMKDAIKMSYNQLFNLFCIINQGKIKQSKKRLKFSFECEKEFKDKHILNIFRKTCKNL